MEQDTWNKCNPHLVVAQDYAPIYRWRSSTEFFTGKEPIIDFLKNKWSKELDYKLMKEFWC